MWVSGGYQNRNPQNQLIFTKHASLNWNKHDVEFLAPIFLNVGHFLSLQFNDWRDFLFLKYSSLSLVWISLFKSWGSPSYVERLSDSMFSG